jgi:hypothetical protein
VLVAVSPFARSANSGHPLIDDQFYFSYLKDTGEDFIYYTSAYSASQISIVYPEAGANLRVVDPYEERGLGHMRFARQIEIPQNARVIFFLYTEILVFWVLFLNLLKSFSIVLVSSNNISERRVRQYPIRLWIFFRVLRSRLRRLVLDSEYQVKLVKSISKQAASKCYVRKNHLACPVANPPPKSISENISISFFGPTKKEKPLSPFIDLIKADTEKKINFKVFGVAEEAIKSFFWPEEIPKNVEMKNNWLSHSEYIREFSKSSLVLLTHTPDFNGKLSGNLCECVALRVPYISLPLEPAVTWASRYGKLGFFCDFEQVGWAPELLQQVNSQELAEFDSGLCSLSANYTVEEARKSLGVALLISGAS